MSFSKYLVDKHSIQTTHKDCFESHGSKGRQNHKSLRGRFENWHEGIRICCTEGPMSFD